jgi:hypothetical protein
MTDRESEESLVPRPGAHPLPPPIYNWMSLIGCGLAVVSLTALAFFALVGLVIHRDTGYGGLAFLPPFLTALLGLVLTLAGWLRERWRHKRGRHSSFLQRWVVDPFGMLRGVGLRVAFAVTVAVTFGLLGAGAASVSLVEFTESNTFCGQVCHAVMEPEATVYTHSAHARIDCVNCHVGSGGESYIRAKVNGLRQVWAVATDQVRRPIPTPIEHRRSSDEMCASCHSADRMIGHKTFDRSYFLNGQESEPLRLRMLVHVGGPQGATKGEGIHFHMLFERKVEYIARDHERQDIAWLRVTQPDGSVEEYENEDEPLTDEERESLPVRTMECVDCHSRPAHVFTSPIDSVNAALADGRIPSGIPYIKEGAVRALDADYQTVEEAMQAIEANLLEFYQEEHPDELDGDAAQTLGTSVAVLRDIYRSTIFPEMKADWKAHPNNIGHRDSLGCFRCHNDSMVSSSGDPVFTDCNRCHSIMAQGEDTVAVATEFDEGLAFVHPEDWDTVEEFTLCSDCHTGGKGLYE